MPANPQQIAADLNVSIQDLNAVSAALGKPVGSPQVAAFVRQAREQRVTIGNAISAYQASGGTQATPPRATRPSASTPLAEPGLMSFEDLLAAADEQAGQTDAAIAHALAQAGSRHRALDALAQLEMEDDVEVIKRAIEGFVEQAAAHHFAIGTKQPAQQDALYQAFWTWVEQHPVIQYFKGIDREDKAESIRAMIERKSAAMVRKIRASSSMAATMATLPATLPSLPSAAPLQLTAAASN